MTPKVPVSITGFAGCTSLGYSLGQTLAAMGAGLSNFNDSGLKNQFGTPVTAASLLHRDLPRVERLRSLLSIGLADVRELLDTMDLGQLPLLLGVPADIDADEYRSLHEEIVTSSTVGSKAAWFPYGRASIFPALANAIDLVERGAEAVLVGGLDSLCALPTIHRLVQFERVLGPHTEGMIPGEAAVFAVLVGTESGRADPRYAVRLEAVTQRRSHARFTQRDRISGDDLAVVFRTFRELGAQRVERVIAAHSGEGYFAHSFAYAYLREVEIMPEPLEVDMIADRVGDVGAAAGTLGLAFATYSLVTDPRSTYGRALVYSESDSGEIGAAIIAGAPSSWDRRQDR
jgi:hypothetical protein